jgi:hypothetical protein
MGIRIREAPSGEILLGFTPAVGNIVIPVWDPVNEDWVVQEVVTPTAPVAPTLPRANAFGLLGTGAVAPAASASGASVQVFSFTAPAGLGITAVLQASVLVAAAGAYNFSVSLEYSPDNAAWSSLGNAIWIADFSANAQVPVTMVGAINANLDNYFRLTVGNDAGSVGNVEGLGGAVLATECDLF